MVDGEQSEDAHLSEVPSSESTKGAIKNRELFGISEF